MKQKERGGLRIEPKVSPFRGQGIKGVTEGSRRP